MLFQWAQKRCSGVSFLCLRPQLFHKLELHLSAGALGIKGHTFHRIKNSFWKVEGAGFETGFSVPKARALPTHQSYAVSLQFYFFYIVFLKFYFFRFFFQFLPVFSQWGLSQFQIGMPIPILNSNMAIYQLANRRSYCDNFNNFLT